MPTKETLAVRLLTASLLCSLLLALPACGQRGPLYLPEDKPAASAPQEEAKSEEKEDEQETSRT